MSYMIGNMVVDLEIPMENMIMLPVFQHAYVETLEFNPETGLEEYMIHSFGEEVGLPIGEFKFALEVWGAMFAGFAPRPVPVFNTNPTELIKPNLAFKPK